MDERTAAAAVAFLRNIEGWARKAQEVFDPNQPESASYAVMMIRANLQALDRDGLIPEYEHDEEYDE